MLEYFSAFSFSDISAFHNTCVLKFVPVILCVFAFDENGAKRS